MTEFTGAPPSIYYFAYGSNMSARRMSARVPSAKTICSAILPGYRLAFHKRGFDGSAKCDVVQTSVLEHCVHGVLYTLDSHELSLLDMAEGRGYGYDRRTVAVRVGSKRTQQAECYFATDIASGGKPFHWYLEHILVGARDGSLPAGYVEQLLAIEAEVDLDERRSARELSIYTQQPGNCT